MNPDIKKQWVEALRSGDYQQGRNALRSNDQFCCLGVLCDLAVKADVGSWNEVGVGAYRIYEFIEKGDRDEIKWGGVLPPAVLTWAGMDQTDNNPLLKEGTQATILNDVDRLDFNAIADLVEENL